MTIHTFSHIKLASDKDKNKDSAAKKALAIAGSTAVGGLPGGYSAYKGAKDKEEGKSNTGNHAAGHGTLGAAGGAVAGATLVHGSLDPNFDAKTFERKKTKAKRIAKNKKLIRGKMGKVALIAGGVGAGIGALKGAATYHAGRLAADKTDKNKD